MTNFTARSGIPDVNDNPSDDQPDMQINNDNFIDIWDVDHIGFNAANGGTHLQNTYSGFSNGNILGGSAASTAYPAAGVDNINRAQYYFRNSNSIVPVSSLKAFGIFSTSNVFISPDSLSLQNSYNVTGNVSQNLVATATTQWVINLVSNTLSSTSAAVFINFSDNSKISNFNYVLALNTLTITALFTSATPLVINFQILQI
jgi:hypothetical protein